MIYITWMILVGGRKDGIARAELKLKVAVIKDC
jgi:hypothetical protein